MLWLIRERARTVHRQRPAELQGAEVRRIARVAIRDSGKNRRCIDCCGIGDEAEVVIFRPIQSSGFPSRRRTCLSKDRPIDDAAVRIPSCSF